MDEQDFFRELAARDRVIEQQAAQVEQLTTTNLRLQEEVERLKQLLHTKGKSKAAKPPTFTDNYSIDANLNKRKRAQRKKPPGRRPKDAKRSQVGHEIQVYPDGVSRKKCQLVREQFAWRLIDGKAVYVRYQIYDLPESQDHPLPQGLRTSRSEFGLEILLVLAFLHYWVGVSLDHTLRILEFFTSLTLSKSQADSLLSQLARDWQDDYETISELIARQMVVYIDETGWKVGTQSCYTWVFSTAMLVLFRCGVSRGKEEAETVLGDSFSGCGVSDDYSAYQNLFSEHQLCWAHLLRKAIKLVLQHPDQQHYAAFLRELCEIYQQAVRDQKDRRLSVGRWVKVLELQGRIKRFCTRAGSSVDGSWPGHEQTFVKLQNELVGNLEKLFVFVEHPEVEATNNRSERNLRREAEVRKGGRTSKTANGSARRGIIMTVLASLRTRFEKFTLQVFVGEVQRWFQKGCSLFEAELEQLHAANPPPLNPSEA